MIALALTFFLVTNPVGNSPVIIALVKDYDFKKQQRILFREALFALILALFFQYFGRKFLGLLNIQDFVVTISGGILLLLVAFSMIFSLGIPEKKSSEKRPEPFIVPIATPILSGPGLLAVIMLKSQLVESSIEVTLAIFLAWVGVMLVMGAAPYMDRILGKRGLAALEQVMGLILAFISMEMLVKGTGDLMRLL